MDCTTLSLGMKKTLESVFKNQWTITLIATMLGVLAAIYLSDIYQGQKLNTQKDLALAAVLEEMSKNEEELTEYHETLRRFYEPLSAVMPYLNEGDSLIMLPAHKDTLLEAFPNIFEITGQKPTDGPEVNYALDIRININSRFIVSDLSDLAWSLFKQTEYLTLIGFQCIYSIEFLYELQHEVDGYNQAFVQSFTNSSGGIDRQEILQNMKRLIGYQEILILSYQQNDNIMEPCEFTRMEE